MSSDSWRNPAELPLDWMPLRRAAEKVGRNDPCPCGSGKKYKRCCEAKDRQREASPYAGMTMDEALSDPGRHGDPRIIEKIPEEQLVALERSKLASAQLVAMMRRASDLPKWELAEAALEELAGRDDDLGQHVDDVRAELVRKLVVASELDRLAAQLDKVTAEGDPLFAAARVALARLRNEGSELAELDRLLAVELDHGPCMMEIADILRAGKCPALALALIRATSFEQLSDADLDLLSDDAEALRTELELAAHDPVVGAHLELLERIEEERGQPDLIEQKAKQNAELLDKLRSAREEMRQLEAERVAAQSQDEGHRSGHGESATVAALKRKLDGLKAEIRTQQDERRELRRRLREDEAGERPAAAPVAEVVREEPEVGAELPEQRPLKPVDFGEAFARSLGGLEPKLVLKAQEQAVRFAAYDPAMWHHAKKLADFDDLYSLRIGIHHRLLLRRSAEGGVEARELVTRERHDAVVARYRR